MLRISEIKVSINQGLDCLKSSIVNKLKIKDSDLIAYTIFKKSVDARRKDNIQFVYTVDVEVKNEEKVFALRSKDPHVMQTPDISYQYVKTGNQKLSHPPVVVGSGPAGLFAGLILAQMGYCPIVLERGKAVEERSKDVDLFWRTGKLNPESNVQFGEGGAGTFSDGKLTTQIKDTRCRKILEELVVAGAPEEIIYYSKPHVGTDHLRRVVKNLRETIKSLGGEVRFGSKATDIIIENGKIKGVEVNGGEVIPTEVAVMAVGHSARDTFKMLHQRGTYIQQKAFSIGVRIEHPQTLINKSQYGSAAENPNLGAADYKLSYHAKNGRSAYTFCMCPGGQVVASSSEEGGVVTNGMSYYARDLVNANSALLVGVGPDDFDSDHPLAGVHFQQKWEKKAFEAGGSTHYAPAQLVKDFLIDTPSTELGEVKPSYTPGVKLTDLRECLPEFVTETMKEAIVELDRKLKGFAMEDAVMTGVETRSSSPIRILRNESCEGNIQGLYPSGEGAGYAGGIISAAVDGVKVAEAIAQNYAPLKC
ncbi:NAD(P)/FAD-dependent oxidoreductase [Alkaliphilus hydrothermalis]|uniref:FAD-dependent dehydrogenase n=1 Tax=Alkaliphilus hydrothermalis TaxID=1482730 RepID=A0ABS2NMZ2_9FIRM|nr:NAD(P)/FAD-dependent oxidoreductase [Alkaliphilus hydrothermalis]MBM7614315.1 putative FAD-dependent dehydrogenase [Alkaliphilus hydrothermalis]